jgi:hypothetical protein
MLPRVDDRVRTLQRAWQANPGDHARLRALIAARRRANNRVPSTELDAQRVSASTFRSELPFRVYAEDSLGRSGLVGGTPGEVAILPCRFWWVEPKFEHKEFEEPALSEAELAELEAQEIPGLRLRGGELSRELSGRLAGLLNLRYLALQGVGVDDVCLEGLEALELLESLSLNTRRDFGPRQFKKSGLAALGRLPSLVHLKLRESNQLTSDDLEALGELTSLSVLRLDTIHAKGEFLAHLGALENLRVLSLQSCNKISGKAFGNLPALPGLRRLDLSGASFTNPGLAHVGRQTGLEELDLYVRGGAKAPGLAHLSGLERLRKLSVNVADEKAAERIATLESLLSLELNGEIGSAWGPLSQGLQRLRELTAPFWSEEEVRELPNFGALETLRIQDLPGEEPLESKELLPVRAVSGLRVLNLDIKQADASTLECVSELESLTTLHVHPLDTKHADWEPLTRLPQLRALHANCAPAAMVVLRPLGLAELHLAGDLAEGHAEELTHWLTLEVLGLGYTTKPGEGDEVIQTLPHLPALREVIVDTARHLGSQAEGFRRVYVPPSFGESDELA